MTRRWIGFLFAAGLAGAAPAPQTAAQLLDQARTQAAAGQRAIFAVFHASW
jgi:hypothetical protein